MSKSKKDTTAKKETIFQRVRKEEKVAEKAKKERIKINKKTVKAKTDLNKPVIKKVAKSAEEKVTSDNFGDRVIEAIKNMPQIPPDVLKEAVNVPIDEGAEIFDAQGFKDIHNIYRSVQVLDCIALKNLALIKNAIISLTDPTTDAMVLVSQTKDAWHRAGKGDSKILESALNSLTLELEQINEYVDTVESATDLFMKKIFNTSQE